MQMDSFNFKGHDIFYHFHQNPKERHMIVYLNGLADTMRTWKSIVDYFRHDHSCLLVDLLGQGETLERQLEKGVADFHYTPEEQCEALDALLTHLGIKNKIHLVGFSYGGGIATRWATLHPQKISKLILLLPYIIRLDQAYPINRLMWSQVNFMKAIPGPWGRSFQMFDRLYSNFLHEYMHYRYANRIPDGKHREVAINLSEEIMKFNTFDVLHMLPEQSTYLLTVSKDTLIPNSLYHEFWDRIPDTSKRAWLKINNGEHLLLEQAPLLVAHWLERIIESKKFEGVLEDAV